MYIKQRLKIYWKELSTLTKDFYESFFKYIQCAPKMISLYVDKTSTLSFCLMTKYRCLMTKYSRGCMVYKDYLRRKKLQ